MLTHDLRLVVVSVLVVAGGASASAASAQAAAGAATRGGRAPCSNKDLKTNERHSISLSYQNQTRTVYFFENLNLFLIIMHSYVPTCEQAKRTKNNTIHA